MRVVFTVLDALPARHVGTDHTPVLVELARAGGRHAGDVARSVMTSATYPNHANVRRHGLLVVLRRHRHQLGPAARRAVPSWELGPWVPTLFDVCAVPWAAPAWRRSATSASSA